jgi:uncharacterized protein YndB with AHSA1/START domain
MTTAIPQNDAGSFVVKGAAMQPIQTDLVINAPRHLVWDALADIRSVVAWNPGIDDVECLSEKTTGLGARRRCFTHPTGWMTESISEWQEGRLIAFSIEDAPPLKNGVARFILGEEDGATRLDARFEYEVKLGPIGPVVDRLIVYRKLSAAWRHGIEGLRNYTETQWVTARATSTMLGDQDR